MLSWIYRTSSQGPIDTLTIEISPLIAEDGKEGAASQSVTHLLSLLLTAD